MFITFEGPDGGGKTTQAALLVERLIHAGHQALGVHEPGGTDLGQHVRAILVGRTWTTTDPWAEALLFSACRAQLVTEVIQPALAKGIVVVADRFADSTRAYQGAGRGLDRGRLESLIAIAIQDIESDLTILLDVPTEIGIARNRAPQTESQRGAGASQMTFFEELRMPDASNRFESELVDFHQRVRAAYRELAAAEPERWTIVDATAPVDQVAELVWDTVRTRLETKK